MMNQRNLIIGAIVIVGAYFIYKKYYTKPTITTTKPKLPPTEPIDKGEPIVPTTTSTSSTNPISTSSFDSFSDDGL